MQLSTEFILPIVKAVESWVNQHATGQYCTLSVTGAGLEYLLAALVVGKSAVLPPIDVPRTNWCTIGYTVMVPDGREGRVSSTDGDICRVIADGEAYATLIPHFIVEPVYPQNFAAANMGH